MKRVRFDSCSGEAAVRKLKQFRQDTVISRKRACICTTPLQFERQRMLKSINCRYHELLNMELQRSVMSLPLMVERADRNWREESVDAPNCDDSVARHDFFEDGVDASLKLMHCVTLNTFKNSHSSCQIASLVAGRGLIDRHTVQSVTHANVDLEALAITSPSFSTETSSIVYNTAATDSPSSETTSTCSDEEFYRMFDDTLE